MLKRSPTQRKHLHNSGNSRVRPADLTQMLDLAREKVLNGLQQDYRPGGSEHHKLLITHPTLPPAPHASREANRLWSLAAKSHSPNHAAAAHSTHSFDSGKSVKSVNSAATAAREVVEQLKQEPSLALGRRPTSPAVRSIHSPSYVGARQITTQPSFQVTQIPLFDDPRDVARDHRRDPGNQEEDSNPDQAGQISQHQRLKELSLRLGNLESTTQGPREQPDQHGHGPLPPGSINGGATVSTHIPGVSIPRLNFGGSDRMERGTERRVSRPSSAATVTSDHSELYLRSRGYSIGSAAGSSGRSSKAGSKSGSKTNSRAGSARGTRGSRGVDHVLCDIW